MIITTAFGHLILSLFLLGQIEHFLNWHLIEYDFFHNQVHFVLFILVAACADIFFSEGRTEYSMKSQSRLRTL